MMTCTPELIRIDLQPDGCNVQLCYMRCDALDDIELYVPVEYADLVTYQIVYEPSADTLLMV